MFSPFGYWSEWSPCQHNGLSCGVRWGHQTRTRVLSWKVPEELSSICPPSKESRRCRMKKRCPKGELVGRGRMKRGMACESSRTMLSCYKLCTLCYKLESNPIRCCLVYDLPPTCTVSVCSWLGRLLSWKVNASVFTEFT